MSAVTPPMHTPDEVRTALDYEPETGEFRWLISHHQIGLVAGLINERGYRRIQIGPQKYYAHRLAWAHFYGAWPLQTVDHINGNRADNRIGNLRDISFRENTENRLRARRGSQSGLLGAYPEWNHFRAGICVNGKQIYLGSFATAEAAHEAYLVAKRAMHTGNTL